MKMSIEDGLPLIRRLIKKVREYAWHGWLHSRSDSPLFRVPAGHDVYTIGVRTVSPKTLVEISLRLCYLAPWKEHSRDPKFYPDKYFYWFRINVLDPFARKGRKSLCDIICRKEEEGTDEVLKLFEKTKEGAVFHEEEKRAVALVNLREVLKLL